MYSNKGKLGIYDLMVVSKYLALTISALLSSTPNFFGYPKTRIGSPKVQKIKTLDCDPKSAR